MQERHAAFVAADNYGLAAMLAQQDAGTIVGAEPRWAYLDLPFAAIAGQAGLLIRSRRRTGPPDPAPWASIEPAGTLTRSRDGLVAEDYDVFRVTARHDMARLPTR